MTPEVDQVCGEMLREGVKWCTGGAAVGAVLTSAGQMAGKDSSVTVYLLLARDVEDECKKSYGIGISDVKGKVLRAVMTSK